MQRFPWFLRAGAGLVLLGLVSVRAAGPGTVQFSTFVRNVGIDAPVFDVDCQTRLDSRFVAQLYAGPSADALGPVGPAVPFRDSGEAGTGYVLAYNEVVIPTVAAGQVAYVQMRAWEPPAGFEHPGTILKLGKSGIITVVTGGDTGSGPPALPAALVGLEGFCLQVMKYPPEIVQQPIGWAVYPGRSWTLQVGIRAGVPAAFQWQFNGQDIAGAVEPAYTIPKFGAADAGIYRVRVSNEVGAVWSSEADMRLVPPPAGATISFSNFDPVAGVDAPVFDTDCTTPLAGDGFAVQLYVGRSPDQLQPIGGDPLGFGPPERPGYWSSVSPAWLQLDREPGLSEPALQPGETVFVQVRAWKLGSGVSTFEEAVLAGGRHGQSKVLPLVTGGVGEPPTYPASLAGLESFCLGQIPILVRQPEGGSVPLGAAFALEVTAASATPLAYQWLLNGQEIPGATSARLELPVVTAAHAGIYSVRVSNATGSRTSAGVILEILELPAGATVYFSNLLPAAGVDAPVREGETGAPLEGARWLAQLYAGPEPGLLVAVGRPQPFGTGAGAGYWLVGDPPWVAIPSVVPGALAYVQVRVWDGYIGAHFEEAVAALARVGASEVLPVLTNGGDSPAGWAPLSGLKPFAVGRQPQFTREPAAQNAEHGATVRFDAEVASDLPTRFQWTRDGLPIPDATNLVLTLANVSLVDVAAYALVAANAAGTSTSRVAWLGVHDLAHGVINFNNHVPASGVDAPVLEADGVTRVQDPALRARLWAGPDSDHLIPVGEPVTFRSGAGAGYWQGVNLARYLPTVEPGAPAAVQVRVWDASVAADFATAFAAGARAGVSTVFTMRTGGEGKPPSFPTDLVGLESFRLLPALRITEPPTGGLYFVGEPVRLQVGAAGGGALTYAWFRNGQPIPGADGETWNIAGVTPADAGAYAVRVSDGTRSLTSPAVLVGVIPVPTGAVVRFSNRPPGPDAPVFDLNGRTPVDGAGFVAELWAGAAAETLAPVGLPVPFLAGAEAGYWDDSSGMATRVIPGVVAGARAYVQVRVWEWAAGETFDAALAAGGRVGRSAPFEVTTGGGTARPANLDGLASFALDQLPQVTGPSDFAAYLNRPASFWVTVVAGPSPLTYEGSFNGTPIPGASGPGLDIARAVETDAGLYSVTVRNAVGATVSRVARLTVTVPTGGGELALRNGPTGPVDAPIADFDGTRLAGPRFRAQLWVGRTADALVALWPSSVFLTGLSAGYVAPTTVRAPNIPPDEEAWVELRVWDTQYGTTYAAAEPSGRVGRSALFHVTAGGLGVPPAALTGLTSFRLQAGELRIIRQPADYYWVIEGTPIYFQIVATNYVSIRWERFTTGGWVTLAGETDPVLNFTMPTVADAGEFRAVLLGTGTLAVASSTATLAVGRRVEAGAGGDFTLRVPAAAGPVFAIEGSTNLVEWSPLSQVTNETEAIQLTEDPAARAAAARYYRARSVASGEIASENIAGFIEVELLPGWSMVGLPLIPPSARVADLFAGMPEFTELYKHYADGRGFTINTLWQGWSSPDEELLPGEACLLGNPTDDVYRLTLHGDVPTGELRRTLPAGWSLQALPVPLSGELDSELGCPFRRLEMIARWDAWPATLDFNVYVDGGWFSGTTFTPVAIPVIRPGEGFWVWKEAPQEWQIRFDPPR